ncbi:radical SAM protein [bacterium]|nr:radical SAM protein [bacterium]
MPNLILTTKCNLDCSYCFGRDVMQKGGNKIADMSMEIFHELKAWIIRERQKITSVHLMGGEPTLNHNLVEMACSLLDEGLAVSIFSNCSTSESPVCAQWLKDKNVTWVVNVNPPESRTAQQDSFLRESLETLGEAVVITLNILPQQMDYEWTLDLIAQYGLARKIKIGFVLPTLSKTNEYLSDEDYPVVAERVVEFARLCNRFDVKLEYECGVPWCSFTTEQLGALWACNSSFFSSCDSRLDILPDGRVIYCLPLAELCSVAYSNFYSYREAKKWFEGSLSPYRPLGSKTECPSCRLMIQGPCRGGCLARTLSGAKNIEIGGRTISNVS